MSHAKEDTQQGTVASDGRKHDARSVSGDVRRDKLPIASRKSGADSEAEEGRGEVSQADCGEAYGEETISPATLELWIEGLELWQESVEQRLLAMEQRQFAIEVAMEEREGDHK